MSALNLIRRCASFYRRHGFRSTVVRFCVFWQRLSYLGRMILFSCPLPTERPSAPAELHIDRVDGTSISKADYQCILDAWNPTIRARQLANRFAAGSELWLAKVDDRLAGFGWTIQGRTMEPHFFPMLSSDAHLFDFFVFPAFRGRGINVALVMEILHQLGGKNLRRAHIECAAWNDNQIRSLRKTPFHRDAEATKLRVFGRTVVIWRRLDAS